MTLDRLLTLAAAVQDLLPKVKPEPAAPVCPSCGSDQVSHARHISNSMGDVTYKHCMECEFEWDHT